MEQMPLGLNIRQTHNEGSIADRFERFHRLNPHVLESILESCDELWASKVRKASIKLIFEHLRWKHLVTYGDDFELNNSFHSYYARVVLAMRPKLWAADFFETRSMRADVGWTPNLRALGLKPKAP